MVNINPKVLDAKTLVPTVLLKYQDGEIAWFQKFVDKELLMYRCAESGEQELSTILDVKKWIKRKNKVEEECKTVAANLINLMAVRSGLSRTPCIPTEAKYLAFEASFGWNPTPDQEKCFNCIEHDMVYNTRPMDRLM